jgi:hypothetical protein
VDPSRKIRLHPPYDKRRGVIPVERYPIDWIRFTASGDHVLTASSAGVVRWSWPEGRRVAWERGVSGQSPPKDTWRSTVDGAGRFVVMPVTLGTTSARARAEGQAFVVRDLEGRPGYRLRAPDVDPRSVRCVALAPAAGELLVGATEGRILRLVEPASGARVVELDEGAAWTCPDGDIDSCGYAGEDHVWVAGRATKKVYLLTREELRVVHSWPLVIVRGWAHATHRFHPLCGLVGGDRFGGVYRYLPGDAEPTAVGPPGVPGGSWDLSADGRLLASGGEEAVRVYALPEPGGTGGTLVAEVEWPGTRHPAVAFAPGGERLLVARSGHVRFLELDG